MKMYSRARIKPRMLKMGETIGVVAPAWSFDPDYFRRGVEYLRLLGYKVKYDNAIFSKYWSMAGHDKERANQINRMFADPEIRAIVCATAGYGSIRTIPYLSRSIIKRNPKIFIGYSDITILLYYLYQAAGMVVFHGPVVSDEIYEGMNPINLDYLLLAITQKQPLGEMQFPSLRMLKAGKASGILVGGTMSLVISAIGTPYDIDTEDKIIFLEDIGEDLEVIDSYLMHLRLAGKFKKARGIVFGRMVDCVDHSGTRYTLSDVIHNSLRDLDIPVVYGFPSGHQAANDLNITLPLGVSVTLDADKTSLTVNESAVR
jgi:muramoyltetrapeptide carboxypeptidase